MQEAFPVTNPNYELHITALDYTLFKVVKASGLPKRKLGMSEFNQWQIPRLAAEYLLKCDGRTTHADISKTLRAPFRIAIDRAVEHLTAQTGVITFNDTPTSTQPGLFATGSFDSFAPLHISVEITETCNFLCDHCYVSASPWKVGKREFEDTTTLFDSLRKHGVKVLEITGGECTTHPQFKEILADAAERFHLVAIITNGFILGTRQSLADWVGSFDNVCVQVSIDGLRDFHDRFRQKSGAFNAACHAVRRLKERDVIVRVAMSVTPENVGEVEGVFLLAKELGADAFSLAPVTTFGRAQELGMCADMEFHIQHLIAQALAPYANDPLFDANRLSAESFKRTKEINCGAGWRTFALNGVSGEVRSCLFLADSKKFGSVDRDEYDDIFTNPYMTMFRNAPSPSPSLDTCRTCRFLPTCNGCFAKAFRVSETEYPTCPWRQKYFPGMSLSLATDQLVQIGSPFGTMASQSSTLLHLDSGRH